MTLLDRILARGLEFPADPIIAERVERHLRRIRPDPLFRRRLRSVVVNRYVASREGMAVPVALGAARRQMGMLGRGVLYASLLTAVGVTAVGAASQTSLPGDALYGVKLGIEQFRMQVAPPGLRVDLAALALDERLDEVEQLASAGRWGLLDQAAARAAAAEAMLESLSPDGAALGLLTGENSVDRHAERLAGLIATAPAFALDGLERALAASTAARPATSDGVGGNGPAGAPSGGAGQGQPTGPGGASHDPRGGGVGSGRGTADQGNEGTGAAGGSGSAPRGQSQAPQASAAPSAPPGGGSGDAGSGNGNGGDQNQQ